jgi:leucyl aminopeptidase (aminopeptidase T)
MDPESSQAQVLVDYSANLQAGETLAITTSALATP